MLDQKQIKLKNLIQDNKIVENKKDVVDIIFIYSNLIEITILLNLLNIFNKYK